MDAGSYRSEWWECSNMVVWENFGKLKTRINSKGLMACRGRPERSMML